MQIGSKLPEMHNTSRELHNAYDDVVKVRFAEIKYMKYLFNDVLEIKNGKNQKLVENPEGLYHIYGSGGIIGYADKYICEANTVIIGRKGSINNPIYVSEPFWNVDTAFGLSPKQDILLPRYLFYFCKNYNFEKLNKTVTIPSLTKADLLKIQIDLPSIDEQQRIVDKLIKVETIINLRNYQVQQLDDLIKARFVEMFGNPLDKSKANMYFVECVEFNPKKSEVKDLMCETVSFVPMECVGADGSFKIKEDGLVKDYYKGYTYFKNGDVLLAKITPCFENGKVAIAENCTNGIGFGTTEFHVSRPIPGVSNSQWIKYMLKNEHVHELATINMTGSAGQKRIQTPFFEKLKVYLPPIELQNQFADFVSQIDKSKATVQKALDETQLLFDSLMQQYFG